MNNADLIDIFFTADREVHVEHYSYTCALSICLSQTVVKREIVGVQWSVESRWTVMTVDQS